MTTTVDERALDVTRFWREAGPDAWFRKDDAFDADFRARFLDLHYAAARRELDGWVEHPEGVLALMILLDQFPRNVYRRTGHAFATDSLALAFARRALDHGHDQAVSQDLRRFFYLPFQHSEALADQDRAVALFQTLDRTDDDRWAEHHHGIIARFGRFPHRNAPLGRDNTPQEQAFLDEGGFTGQPANTDR